MLDSSATQGGLREPWSADRPSEIVRCAAWISEQMQVHGHDVPGADPARQRFLNHLLAMLLFDVDDRDVS